MPIIVYSIVQTGAKIQLGGLKKGLFRKAYHSVIPFAVAAPEANPIPKQMTTQMIIFNARFILSKFDDEKD